MFVSRSIPADHKDLIHDVAYDFYGERLATCSSDQTVKTHCGSVWKVTWAHPEFGQVIATCSFDRTVAVWEELGLSKDLLLEAKDSIVENEDNEENLLMLLWLEKHGVNIFPRHVTENFKSYDDKVNISGNHTDDDIVSENEQKNDVNKENLEEHVKFWRLLSQK
ncbi:unnamed protein product [Larinioides sclopetarius]|uniref:Uncharacterized protein n=1 Tax=Larinioides sclopetarius TaxID=280406 RepID=A0AAV1Z0J7_9ARAC